MPLESLPVELLYSIHLDTAAPVMVTGGPTGTRIIAPVTGGTFEGPRMRGTVVGPAGAGGAVCPAGNPDQKFAVPSGCIPFGSEVCDGGAPECL